MSDNTKEQEARSAEEYISMLDISNRLTEKAIRDAIREFGLFNGCRVLDLPCGIGSHSIWMAEECPGAEIRGVDIAEEHLSYARGLAAERKAAGRLSFETGDMKKPAFDDDSFDFVWCCDGLWPGPPEQGCINEEPYTVLNEFKRIVKPGGTIAAVFWTAQKLLPGYPLLETTLTSTVSANRPSNWKSRAEIHILRAPEWLEKIGLTNIQARTFACDIQGPLTVEDQAGMIKMADMFWGGCEKEVTPDVWNTYKYLTDPGSKDFIFGLNGYAGIVTYTMYTGVKPK